MGHPAHRGRRAGGGTSTARGWIRMTPALNVRCRVPLVLCGQTGGVQERVVYVELKRGFNHDGPAWIGRIFPGGYERTRTPLATRPLPTCTPVAAHVPPRTSRRCLAAGRRAF